MLNSADAYPRCFLQPDRLCILSAWFDRLHKIEVDILYKIDVYKAEKICYNKNVNKKLSDATSRKDRVIPMQSEIEQFYIPHSAAGQDGTGMGSRCF